MSQPVTVFRWDDAGAPQLPNGKPSEIIDILTKCLVDGYGDKTPLGWTRPFYDAGTQAVAFRNSVADGGSGGYAKFYSNDASDNNNAMMLAIPAQSMTNISSLFRPGYIRPFAAQSGVGDLKMDKWALIGTATAFYFFISRNNRPMYDVNGYGATLFVGDFYSIIPNDAGRFIVLGSPSASGDDTSVSFADSLDQFSAFSPITSNPTMQTLKLYDADGADDFAGYVALPPLGQGTGSNPSFNGPPTFQALFYPITVELSGSYTSNFSNTFDRDGVLVQRSFTRPQTRGVIPGMFINKHGGYGEELWPKTVTVDNQLYWLLRNTGGPPRVYINAELWNDPFSAV